MLKTLSFAVSLFAFAAPAPAAQDAPPIVAVEAGFRMDFGDGAKESGLSLYQFIQGAAFATGTLFLWDGETEALLRERRVRLLGQKTVSTSQFSSFLQVLVLTADFVCIEVGDGSARILRIEPLSPEAAAPGKANGTSSMVEEEDRYVLHFGEGAPGETLTLFQFVQSCANVTGMQFTWSRETEAELKKRSIRLQGTKSVPKEQFPSFLQAVMLISEMTCTEVGDEAISVLMIAPVSTSEEAAADGSAEGKAEAQVFRFDEAGEATDLSLFDLAQRFASGADLSFTWSPSTEALLQERTLRLLGELSLPGEQLVPAIQALFDSAGFRCRQVGDAEVSVLKIDVD